MNTIDKVNEMLNNSVAYARKAQARGGYELRFSNTHGLITISNNENEFISEVKELVESGVQQGNSTFDISKNGTLKI